MKIVWVTYLGALSRLNAILIPRISARPPILAQCKVHRPWALFREGTVYVSEEARARRSLLLIGVSSAARGTTKKAKNRGSYPCSEGVMDSSPTQPKKEARLLEMSVRQHLFNHGVSRRERGQAMIFECTSTSNIIINIINRILSRKK